MNIRGQTRKFYDLVSEMREWQRQRSEMEFNSAPWRNAVDGASRLEGLVDAELERHFAERQIMAEVK